MSNPRPQFARTTFLYVKSGRLLFEYHCRRCTMKGLLGIALDQTSRPVACPRIHRGCDAVYQPWQDAKTSLWHLVLVVDVPTDQAQQNRTRVFPRPYELPPTPHS